MSENCNHDCEHCGQSCEERDPESFRAKLHPDARVKKVIGVVSGKGGVGKSLVTGLLASAMQRAGKRTAVLDADITGPSIPKIFGVGGNVLGTDAGILPSVSKKGTQIMSVNLMLDNDTDPVVWRGPIIANVVKQFWTDVIWQDVDYMFVDMPPGTGDVPLTVFQSLPVDGIIVVTSPQELVSMIVGKAVKMAEMMKIPVLGIVENMSYFQCPECGSRYEIFGESHIDELAAQYGIKNTARIPVNPELASACDGGELELKEFDYLDAITAALQK